MSFIAKLQRAREILAQQPTGSPRSACSISSAKRGTTCSSCCGRDRLTEAD